MEYAQVPLTSNDDDDDDDVALSVDNDVPNESYSEGRDSAATTHTHRAIFDLNAKTELN